ncbi:MAG: hybrid sensor histidine kinase/response regulator [Anaerolineae bacterium]|nr:hybrid sensor histidine kinase/response regulator [Anaerolineae bacterium]
MTKKILHIEANPDDRQSVREVLEKEGHTVIAAPDGPSGVQLAQVERPDLILLDMDLPDIDDRPLSHHLKNLPELNDTPLIALVTELWAWSHITEFDLAGQIMKPIDETTLARQIADFLADQNDIAALKRENECLRKYSQKLAQRLEQKIQELTAANEALEHTDLMKSRFINMAAHELRTPLAAVHGYLGVLTSPGSKFMARADENTLKLIEGVVTGIDRLQGLVQDMLDVTRIEAGALQLRYAPIGLTLIFDKIRRDFKNVVARRRQTLNIGEADHVPVMWVDGERVTQILRNLVSNAIKYTPDGGTIEIAADLMQSDDQKNVFVKITVSDTGVGVPLDQQERIFEGFYEVRDIELHSTSKTDFMGGGAGLGLPIARGVAQAHGGSLWLESPGYDPKTCPGCKFYLVLPLGEGLAPKA